MLGNEVFNRLINGEKDSLRITVTMEVSEHGAKDERKRDDDIGMALQKFIDVYNGSSKIPMDKVYDMAIAARDQTS